MLDDLDRIDDRFVFRGARRRYAVFPLGGIGAGGFSLTGAGRMVDWSIRNRPELHQFNGYSHFAIKAEQDGKLLKALVLNGPYEGTPTGSPSIRKFDGFGFGANRDSMAGVPHFSDVTFVGRFPVAEYAFHDERFPGDVRMQALSPFIPHNDRDSSLPAAMFAFEVENTTDAPITYVIAGTLGNFGCDSGIHRFVQEGDTAALHLTSADEDRPAEQRGDLTIMTDAEDVEHVDYHFRGQWFDSLSLYWREFARAGRMPERHYDKPRQVKNMFAQPEHGTLAARITIEPGEKKTVRFVIAWNYPLGSIYWYRRDKPDSADAGGSKPTWKNYYATQWEDSLASARDAFARWESLEGETTSFRDAIFGAAMPPEIIDAATGTMGLLRTATVIRLEGGELWGWEGQHEREGSCEGSCTHVWNYQQALASLFPALERSLRDTEWRYNQLPNGGLTFRQRLPLGSGFDIIGPCADGHFGAIIKTFREWRQSGDDQWLAGHWPNIRRALDYAWSAENPDLWDPEKTGILWGRQHHTLDMELFGPNSWLSSIYVAALKAASEMAAAMGEADFAAELAEMAKRGGAYINDKLFNGRWFAQALDLSDKAFIEPFDKGRAAGVLADSFMDAYWSEEYHEIKYQIGEGCLTDQILGQWHADLSGIGDILDPEKVATALKTIFAESFRPSLVDHFNPCRVYAYEGEGGTLLCSYPEGAHEPAVPAPYAEEVWTGLEYMIASHMILRGLTEEGLTIVRAARDRHDGSNRSPWNDIECGSYYARSLSSYALVKAWTGLTFDQRDGILGFAPKGAVEGSHFWSAGKGWGELAVKGGEARLTVRGGSLEIGRLSLPFLAGSVTADGKAAAREGDVVILPQPVRLGAGETLTLKAG